METFTQTITLFGPNGESEALDALIDTDILFASLPRHVLERLGVRPEERRGRDIGQVDAELGEHRATIMYVFSNDEQARIGRHTLDTFILEPDFENKRLVEKTFRLIQHF